MQERDTRIVPDVRLVPETDVQAIEGDQTKQE